MIKKLSCIALLLASTQASAFLTVKLTPETGSEKISVGAASIVTAPSLTIISGPAALSANAAGSEDSGVALFAPVLAVAGSAFVIVGIAQTAAEGSTAIARVTFEAVNGSVKLAMNVSKSSLEASGAVVGAAVNISTLPSGVLVAAKDKVLAFVPNELGESLIEQAKKAS